MAEASISVSKDISRAGLIDGFLGAQGGQNVQGEDQPKLDVIADNAFIDVLEKGGGLSVGWPLKKMRILCHLITLNHNPVVMSFSLIP